MDMQQSDNSEATIESEITNLLARVDKTSEDAAAGLLQTKTEMGVISKKIDQSVASSDKLFFELDQAENQAGNELDTLMLQYAEDLATD